MKDVVPFIPSKKDANIFFAIYTGAFLLGLLGVLLLPKEEAMLRKVAFGMSYFFGLPVVISAGLVALRKIGVWNGK
jgi:hypothetical protein